jgi:class 3 adenylate cyclase
MVIIQNYTSRSSDNYFVVSNFSESGILVLHTFLCILFQLIVSILFHFSIKYYLPSPLEYLIQNKKMKPESKKAYQELAKIFNSNKEFERSLSNGGEYSRLTLKFKISSRERKYQEYMISKRKRHYFTYLILFTLIVVIFLCVKASYDPIDISSIAIFVILAFSLVLSLLLLKYLEKSSHFLILFKVVYIYSNVLIGLLAILQKSHPSLILVYPCTFLLFLPEDWLTMVSSCTIVSILLFRSATLYMMDFTSGHDLYIAVIQFIGIYSISTMTCGVTTYLLKMQSLQQFNLLQKVKEDYEKVTSVLYYLLPSFVRKRVNNGVRYIADEQGEVSVLFCYIVGFDKITNEYSIEELTALLDEIFGKIDSLCELVGVSKIETVANTYMACAGLIDSESELKASLRAIPHARRAVELGFAILRAAGKIFLKSGEKITLKIGVHSGKVTAGVVGYHKPQFSLVGDTVNTASRMASSAEPNTIRVSKFTYDLVGEAKNFDYTLNLIDVKGKGKMETYTITLNQMKNLDNFIEHRISLSHASMASAGIQSFADESSLSCIQTEDVLEDLKIFPTTQLFELDEGTGLIEKIKWVGLGLKVSEEMKEFRKDFLTKNFSIFFIGSVMKILCDVIMLVTFLLEFMQDDLYIAIGLIIQILVLSVVMFLLGKNRQNIFYYFSLAGVYLLGLVLSIIAYLKYSDSDISAMYILIHFQLAICCSGLFFSQVFIAALLVSVFWLIILIYQGPLSTISVLLPGSIYFISIQVFTLYYWEKYIRAQHNISYMTEKELAKTESLLTQMIPKHVYDHLKDENTVTDYFFQVTIIYADIVGFTPWSSGRDAKEIVNMLSSLFTKFDKSSVENKVYKVHTIGDCYVAMGYHGGANRNPSQECANMINFAYSMLKIIKKVQKENKELNMRIGLHTGDVIGGVMGTSIVRYDIYGTDVLIANQMESNGIPGKIVISETTKSFLEKAQPKSYQYKFHTEVKTLERTCNAYELIKVGD